MRGKKSGAGKLDQRLTREQWRASDIQGGKCLMQSGGIKTELGFQGASFQGELCFYLGQQSSENDMGAKVI